MTPRRNPKALDVVIDTQIDYMLPSRPAHIRSAEDIIVPGLEWLCERNEDNCAGVLFTANKFTPAEYHKTLYAREFPPHCLTGDLGSYDPVGLQNVFSQRLLVSRGVPTFHLYKKVHSMWDVDLDGFPANVHAYYGGVQTSFSLAEFVGKNLDETGVNNVNIWGTDTSGALKDAITGFLLRKFKVRVYLNLCAARVGIKSMILQDLFLEEIKNGQLELMRPLSGVASEPA
jgi:nicotinamidase/pyrazinamidase